jgi:hypothetical protein
VPRSRISLLLDWLALLLAVACVTIALTGGGVFRVAGARITARSPDRAALAMAAVIALRVVLDRRTRPLPGLGAFLGRVRDRVYHPALDDPAPLDPSTRWRRRGLATLGLCAFAALLLSEQLLRMDAVPDLGDPLFSIWRSGWVVHKLQGDPRPLFSPNIFYPHPLALTYSDSMLLPAVTTMPFVMAGMHAVYAYNAVIVLSFIASGLAMYVLAEKLTGSPASAFVSALLFGFHPYRYEHYAHFELLMTYCMPPALLALHRLAATGTIRSAVAAGLFAVGQLYCSMYYAVFFTLYAAAMFVFECVVRRVPIRRLIVPTLAGGAIAMVLAFPLARTYGQARLGDRDPGTVASYSATASDYFRSHPRSALWGERTLPGRLPERALFPGAMVLILAALALIPPIGASRAIYAFGLFAAFEISRGFNSVFYPVLYEWLPFVRGLRVPARCSILVGLSLAVLAGFGVRRLVAGRARGFAAAVVAALTIAIAIDLHPSLRLEPVWLDPPPIYGAVAGNPKAVLAEFPVGGFTRRYTPNVPFLYFSLWHWSNMVNGYSGHSPSGYDEFEESMRPFPGGGTLDILAARGVTHVTITCALYNDSCDQLLARVDAVSRLRLVSSGQWQGQPSRLYELQ